MKKILLVLLLTLSSMLFTYNTAFAAEQTRRVCIKQTDPKTKKIKEVCRQMKIHKKLDGTPVPPKKAK